MNKTNVTALGAAILFTGSLVSLTYAGDQTKAPLVYQFTAIAFPAGSPGSYPTAWGLNNRGTIVGNCSIGDDLSFVGGFIYRDGWIELLPAAEFAQGSWLGSPQAINDSGSIVGVYTDAQEYFHGCTYTPGEGWSALGDAIPDGPSPISVPMGINNKGDIVGNAVADWDGNGPWRAWLLHNGNYELFDVPACFEAYGTLAFAINDRGDIIGDYIDQDGDYRGFLRRGNQYTKIDYPESALPTTLPAGTSVVWTELNAINNSGDIVGWYAVSTDDRLHGFVLSDGVYTTYDFPDTSVTLITGINDKGELTAAEDYVTYFGVSVPRNRTK